MLFMVWFNRNSQQSRHMIALLACYMTALIFLALYLSKDTYYYNTVNHYFALPKSIWKILLLFPVEKSTIIRLCNASVLSVIYLGVLFSLSYLHSAMYKWIPAVKHTAGILLLLELVLYDPAFIRTSYYFLYPRFLTVSEFNRMQMILHGCTMFLNCTLFFMSILFLGLTIRRTPGLHTLRMNIFLVSVSTFLSCLHSSICFYAIRVLW